MRSKLVDDGIIEKGTGPSYYIEGLLYNVPKTTNLQEHTTTSFKRFEMASCHDGPNKVRVRE